MGDTTGSSWSVCRGPGLRVALTLVVLTWSAGVRADGPVLRWKFTPGEALHYQMNQNAVTEVKANGQNIKTTVTQTLETTWAVQTVDASGGAEMSQSIDRLQTKIESPFGTFDYDSKSEKQPEGPAISGIMPILKALIGAKFKYKISASGELSDIQVPESLLQVVKQSGPAAGGGNAGMFSEEGLKNMIRESSLILPPGSLEKPWTRKKEIPAPPIGTQVVEVTYKYDGTENDQARIGMVQKVSLQADPKAEIDAKIGNQDGKGTFVFDTKSGRIVRSNIAQKVQMIVKVMNTEVEQNQETTTEMKLVKADTASK